MKTSAETPRFTCRATRSWLAVFSGDEPVNNRHVAGCEDCQAFFSAGDELEQLLRHDAAAQRVAPSPMLEQKILHAVHRSTAPARRSYATPLFTLVGAAAAIAVAFVALRPAPPPPVTLADGQQALADLKKLVPTDLFTEIRPQAEAIQEPLQNELDAIQDNARTAVRFLAKNFLTDHAQQALANNRG